MAPGTSTNPSDSAEDVIPAIDDFILKNVGEIVQVFHEVVSDELHIDVHQGRSRGDARYQWLFTSGMSRKPMRLPPEINANPYAELVMCLPPDWPLNVNAFRDENNYWPVRLLKSLARYPHENSTWLYAGHSLPRGKSFAANTRMSSVMLLRPQLLGAKPFVRVHNHEVLLWAVCPLYEDELAYKEANGFEALAKIFLERGGSELLDPTRPNLLGSVI